VSQPHCRQSPRKSLLQCGIGDPGLHVQYSTVHLNTNVRVFSKQTCPNRGDRPRSCLQCRVDRKLSFLESESDRALQQNQGRKLPYHSTRKRHSCRERACLRCQRSLTRVDLATGSPFSRLGVVVCGDGVPLCSPSVCRQSTVAHASAQPGVPYSS
jgi:hypothetical protein